jgi:hypothetical protein
VIARNYAKAQALALNAALRPGTRMYLGRNQHTVWIYIVLNGCEVSVGVGRSRTRAWRSAARRLRAHQRAQGVA